MEFVSRGQVFNAFGGKKKLKTKKSKWKRHERKAPLQQRKPSLAPVQIPEKEME